MNRPPQLSQLLFHIRQRQLKRRPPVRTRRSLRKDALALHLERLTPPLALRILKPVMFHHGLRSGSLRLLLLNGLTFPSTRHAHILPPALFVPRSEPHARPPIITEASSPGDRRL